MPKPELYFNYIRSILRKPEKNVEKLRKKRKFQENKKDTW